MSCSGRASASRRIPRLADALPLQDMDQRSCQDAQVKPHRLIVHIPGVQCELLFPGESVAAVYLRPPGNAGFDVMPPELLPRVEGKEFHEEWARTDKAHIAFENVPELGEFVQAALAKASAQAGEPLLVGIGVALFIADVVHGAKLVECERASVQTGAGLAEGTGFPSLRRSARATAVSTGQVTNRPDTDPIRSTMRFACCTHASLSAYVPNPTGRLGREVHWNVAARTKPAGEGQAVSGAETRLAVVSTDVIDKREECISLTKSKSLTFC